jgi:thioredoxin reductase (NADPH)
MLDLKLDIVSVGKDETLVYDVAIIGGGPAGLTAGIYSARALLKTVVFEKLGCGGQLAITDRIENYPGFPEGINGFELSNKMKEQAENFKVKFEFLEVESLIKDENSNCFLIKCGNKNFMAKAVIFATGSTSKRLNIPGENEFWGRGISSCATCDGALFKDKVVAVVGGGDSALDEGLFLTKFAKKVYIIHRRNELRAAKILQLRAMNNPKIEFIFDTVVEEVIGENKLKQLKLKNLKTGDISYLEVDGMFIYIGLLPNTELLKGFSGVLDENGFVITNEKMETNVSGLFAAGDCRNKILRQVATAVADGAIAAYSAEKYLEKLECENKL